MLAFVPPQWVSEAYELVSSWLLAMYPVDGVQENAWFIEYIEYFEQTYVAKRGRGGVRPATYAPVEWNIYQRALEGDCRTNNELEGLVDVYL